MDEIEKFIRSILGENVKKFTYDAGGYERTGFRSYSPCSNAAESAMATKIVEKSWRACHEKDIRLLVGSVVFQTDDGKYSDSSDLSYKTNSPMYVQVLALPALPVVDIVELMKVGSHNDQHLSSGYMLNAMEGLKQQMSTEDLAWLETPEGQQIEAANRMRVEQMFDGALRWQKVRASLARVFAIAPFEIQSADEAHLQAIFVSPVAKAKAKEVGNIIILDIGSDVMDIFEGEWEELGIVVHDPNEPELPDFEATMAEYILTTGTFKLWWD
jgi:hypothetical protein